MSEDPLYYELRHPVNIFYLDRCPELAARAHCDRHVVKMILETAQLLSTAWHVTAPDSIETDVINTDDLFSTTTPQGRDLVREVDFTRETNHSGPMHCYLGGQRIYAATHPKHPSALWVRESRVAYDWTWRLGQALLAEYTFRYGKTHASRHVLRTLEWAPPGLPELALSEPNVAMPEERVVTIDGYVDALASYRNYYRTDKLPLLTYTNREPPDWLTDVATTKTRKNSPLRGVAV